MKNNQLALIVLLGLIIIGAVTNPSFDDHKREISKIVSGNISLDSENPFEILGHSLGGKLVGGLLDNIISVNNFVVFSIGSIEYQGIKKNITLGTFGNVIKLKDLSNAKNDFSPNADYKILSDNELRTKAPETTKTPKLYIGETLTRKYPLIIKCTEINSNGMIDFEIENFGVGSLRKIQLKFFDTNNSSIMPIMKEIGYLGMERKQTISVDFGNSNIKNVGVETLKYLEDY